MTAVNAEMLRAYWENGKVLVEAGRLVEHCPATSWRKFPLGSWFPSSGSCLHGEEALGN